MKNNKKRITFLLIILIATTIGCNLLSQTEDTATNQSVEDEDNSPINGGGDFNGNSQWPTYLPVDVPVLAGEIRIVMGSPETNIRIFYEPLSESQIEQYVELCRENGFEFKYLVFTREEFVDRSGEKLKTGDYDAVEMSKGEYWMRLEYGSDTVTLDINVPGITNQKRATDVPLPWPEDIAASIPQPDHCQVRTIANLSAGGYQITCKYYDGDIGLEAYMQVLKSLGFQETDRLINDENKIVYLIFEDEKLSVKLNPQAFTSTITFQIVPIEP